MQTSIKPLNLIMLALALAAVTFLLATKPTGATEPRLSLTAAVTDCDAYEVHVTPKALLEGEAYRLITEHDPAPFGTWEPLDVIDIGDSEAAVLVHAGELPVNTRYRVTIEVLAGGEWIEATGILSQYDAVATLTYMQASFCPEPTATPEPTPSPTATPEPTATPPTATPVVIVEVVEVPVIVEVEKPVFITPPATGSGGVR